MYVYDNLSQLKCLTLFQGKPYRFSHFLIISRFWRSAPGEEEPIPPSSKKRKVVEPIVDDSISKIYSFHPEDECIQPVCVSCTISVKSDTPT
jgi:hypothetical protein